MTAINNINPAGGGIPPVTREATGPQGRQEGRPKTVPAESSRQEGDRTPGDFQDLADKLAVKLELLGQGHKVAVHWDQERSAPIIQVLNKEGEVLNQFPPQKILNLRQVLAELSGMVINRTT